MIAHRVFWSLVLITQLGLIALAFFPGVTGVRIPPIAIAFEAIGCVALVGLVLQRRVLSHRFWAGAFGVLVAMALVGMLQLAWRAIGGPSGEHAGIVALVTVGAYALNLFAVFVYVYGSRAVWPAPEPA